MPISQNSRDEMKRVIHGIFKNFMKSLTVMKWNQPFHFITGILQWGHVVLKEYCDCKVCTYFIVRLTINYWNEIAENSGVEKWNIITRLSLNQNHFITRDSASPRHLWWNDFDSTPDSWWYFIFQHQNFQQ